MKYIKHKEFLIAYFSIVVIVCLTSSSWRIFKEYPYQFNYGNDVNQYYSYLPQTFIKNDPGFKKGSERGYWLIPNEAGIPLPKMTMGMTLMYVPAFVVGHSIASLSNVYEADGYTLPYSISFIAQTYLYVSIALFLLYLALLYYFKPWISAISIFLIFLGTNLYYYTLCEGEMSHSYLFLLFSIIILNTIRWFERLTPKHLYFISLAMGMAVLIRPTSTVIILFPLLFALNKTNLIEHIKANLKPFLGAIILFLVPLFFQLLYWKIYGGSWVRYSYGDEKFYFTSPHVLDFLFSYRKGWLLYTPLMLFAIIGMIWLPKKIPAMRWSIPLIITIAVYVLSSWWCWWFGGSYGSRAMVEFYALLIFPLGIFIEKIANKKYVNYVFIGLFSFTIFYNILGTHKKTWWQLHWDSMSKEAFWITFSQLDVDYDTKQKLDKSFKTPDYENARKGLPEREEF